MKAGWKGEHWQNTKVEGPDVMNVKGTVSREGIEAEERIEKQFRIKEP